MNAAFDPVTAKIIAGFNAPARRRLESCIQKSTPGSKTKIFIAEREEIKHGLGVQQVRIKIGKGRAKAEIQISKAALWANSALRIESSMPDSAIGAMRNKPLNSIVSHPLFDQEIVSSARRERDDIIVEIKRQNLTDIGSIPTGTEKNEFDFGTSLQKLGVEQVCKTMADLFSRLDQDAKIALTARLQRGRCNITDLFNILPAGVTKITAEISEGILWSDILFHEGYVTKGRLSLRGSDRSNRKILNGLMWRYKLTRGYKYALNKPVTTLEEALGVIKA